MLEHAAASDEDSVMRAVDGGLLRGLQGGTPSSLSTIPAQCSALTSGKRTPVYLSRSP